MREKELIPILHVKTEKQAIANLDLLDGCGIKKVFLTGHDGKYSVAENLIEIALIAAKKGFWVGCNFLGYDTLTMLKAYSNKIDAIWYDNSFAGVENEKTKEIFDERTKISKAYGDHVQLFGGVAFKYCPQPTDLKEACDIAALYMDVVVTSGMGTGITADISKIAKMRSFLGDQKPFGIESGITPENVNNYDVDVLLVSTGISNIGLFPSGLGKIQYFSIEATHHEWVLGQDMQRGNTIEFDIDVLYETAISPVSSITFTQSQPENSSVYFLENSQEGELAFEHSILRP